MSLLPQDIIVTLKLALSADDRLSYAELASELGLSASQVHASVKRSGEAGFLDPETRVIDKYALYEFIVHGLKYVFPPVLGPTLRGVPTAYSALPLNQSIVADGTAIVWPDPKGTVRGESLQPIHRCVLTAAQQHGALYQCLALIDAIRIGRARERKLATKKLKELLIDGPN